MFSSFGHLGLTKERVENLSSDSCWELDLLVLLRLISKCQVILFTYLQKNQNNPFVSMFGLAEKASK